MIQGLAPLALYIHWPFCLSKCPYCDFNSHVRAQVDAAGWETALVQELENTAALIGERRLVSIFFGGGTPSLMPPRTVEALINRARQLWPVSNALEITLEANPTSVEAAKFRDLMLAGVGRVSLGLQALADKDLRFLGRQHSVAEGLKALEVAQRNFQRVSFDLIYAWPGQSLAQWRAELAQALSYGTEHLSLYQLTIEPGTAFHEQYRRGRFQLPDEDLAADLFGLTREMTADAGLPAYEISNHARADAECRHNLVYWQGGEYAGVGPGAHGRLRLGGQWRATMAAKKPEDWRHDVIRQGHGRIEEMPLGPEDRAREMLMMGLRLGTGIDLDSLSHLAGVEVRECLDPAALQDLIGMGLMAQQGGRLQATPEGLPVLNRLIETLLA